MESSDGIDLDSVDLEYLDPRSLMSRKMRIVDSNIRGGNGILLDIGMGTGELIGLELPKFGMLHGIDIDEESVRMCKERYASNERVVVQKASLLELKERFKPHMFECVTCLDVLERLEQIEARLGLEQIKGTIKGDGELIVTVPGITDRFGIALGRAPLHKHAHSSYGWARPLREAGVQITKHPNNRVANNRPRIPNEEVQTVWKMLHDSLKNQGGGLAV